VSDVADLDGCYWVEPGRFLAGPYPGHPDRIPRLRGLGVTLLLDLTEPGEYGLLAYDALLTPGMRAIRKPVRDFTAPSPAEMREILDLIDAELAAGGVVYLHCYGGVGRTGTVVGCHLVRHGTPPEQAIDAIARLRQGTRDAHRSSPESEEQRALIASWEAMEL
jgi:Swiss Army Knife protein, DSP-PTPase phosphatase domain